jgi:hypothetical protein
MDGSDASVSRAPIPSSRETGEFAGNPPCLIGGIRKPWQGIYAFFTPDEPKFTQTLSACG